MTNKSPFHGTFKITGCYKQNWGYWSGKTPHTGLDLVGIDSKQIFSPVEGTVEFAGTVNDGFGNYVRIRDANGHKYYLCHMESVAAKIGQHVTYGDFIGIMGHSGNVTGAHTHFEIRVPSGNGYTLGDPAAYLGLPNKQGTYNSSQVSAVPAAAAKTTFPGSQYFGAGKTNQYILQLGNALAAKGYDKHYKAGPSTSWGDADKLNVQDFQKAQGWTGSDADGLPGAETWRRLGL